MLDASIIGLTIEIAPVETTPANVLVQVPGQVRKTRVPAFQKPIKRYGTSVQRLQPLYVVVALPVGKSRACIFWAESDQRVLTRTCGAGAQGPPCEHHCPRCQIAAWALSTRRRDGDRPSGPSSEPRVIPDRTLQGQWPEWLGLGISPA